MSLDLPQLNAAIAQHGPVARVVIADIKGSSPREVGAAMLVWADGQTGTIGGGALEYQLAQTARVHLTQGRADGLSRHSLGPDMGQCCGGSVQVLTEIYDAARVQAIPDQLYARGPGDTPMAVRKALAQARSGAETAQPRLIQGWFMEPIHTPTRPLWIWGAGHVGRAMINVLAPLPDFAITWVDTAPDRFPDMPAEGVTVLPAAQPTLLIPHAPAHTEHLIVTYSHALDLALCDGLLRHGFGFAGLIGSATKWARFRSRLQKMGHTPASISRITCPIGDPAMGKHPAAIAIGVAADRIAAAQTHSHTKEQSA